MSSQDQSPSRRRVKAFLALSTLFLLTVLVALMVVDQPSAADREAQASSYWYIDDLTDSWLEVTNKFE